MFFDGVQAVERQADTPCSQLCFGVAVEPTATTLVGSRNGAGLGQVSRQLPLVAAS